MAQTPESLSQNAEDTSLRNQLQKVERRFQMTFEQVAVGMAHVALDGHWLLVNQRLCDILGYSREELLHTTFQAITSPQDLEENVVHVKKLLAGEITTYTTEKRYLKKEGSSIWIHLTASLARDEANNPHYFITVIEDIDARKQLELQLAREKERLQDLNANLESMVAQRTEALNQASQVLSQNNAELQRSNQELQDFAYVASHDLQEPLRKIQAFGNLLEEEYGAALGEGKMYVDRMRNASTRMRTLIQDLLTFSRVTTKAQPFVPVDLNEVVHDVIDDLEARLQSTQGTVEVATLPTVDADPHQMYQLFQNLIGNALKFHRPNTPPLVKVYATMQSDPVEALAQTDPAYIISVEDNGIGFDEKYLDRIFTMFQRLHGKNDYEGTGIGLAVVRKIVERHNGAITATSAEGKGATFLVTLPGTQITREENIHAE